MNVYNLLQESKVEKDVEEKYKRIMSHYFPTAKISSPYNTDGFLENGVTMLMECKYQKDLTKKTEVVKILIQLLFELKHFEWHGDDLPNIIFGGDIDECFCLHINAISPYLDEDLDWSIAPSSAADKNPELIKKMCKDEKLNPYVFNYINDEQFDFQSVVDTIKDLNNGEIKKIKITQLNINRFFLNFIERVIKDAKKYNGNTLVSIFLGCLIDKSNNYLHPEKNNILISKIDGNTTDVVINKNLFEAFFDHFDRDYSIEEKRNLTSICDRLIVDQTRRYKGEFYTPTEWVNEAHKLIEEELGENWKDEFVVWDPAWGTGNLTRDFKFKELYCSTLNHGDLNMGASYNPEAIKFQYDFLNDDVVPQGILPVDGLTKLPPNLLKVFQEDKPIVFFMNPPFGRASSGFKGNDSKRTGTAKNKVNTIMINYLLGHGSSQLYTQFLYRICLIKNTYKLSNINILMFSNPLFLTGSSFKNFREFFFNNFNFSDGMLINAGHFSNVSNRWGIMFSLWNNIPSKEKYNFECKIKEFNEDLKIIEIGKKNIYNCDNHEMASIWVRDRINSLEKNENLSVSSGIKVKGINMLTKNAIGYFYNDSNAVKTNTMNVGLFSTCFSVNYGTSIDKDINFNKVVALFTARKVIKENWINQKDEYMIPNIDHPDYKQWNIDAIIYSLFNGSSNQTSLRKVIYKEKEWNIKNEWFWMSNSEMIELANKEGFEELYYDANGDHERFVYNKIQEYKDQFSDDALSVLNKARELTIKTFTYRKLLHEEYPEYHLNSWDAGWYQIRKMINLQFKTDLLDFITLYKAFENRMKEGVYKFGFLK